MSLLQAIRRNTLGPIADIGCSGFLTQEGFDRSKRVLARTAVDRLLDFGCGNGGFGLALAEGLGCAVLGIDRDARSVAEARAQGQSLSLDAVFEVRDFEDRPRPGDPKCDVVVALDSLYLAEDLARALLAMRAYLRPKGRAWLTAYVGDTHEGGVRGRTLATWTAHLAQADLRVDEVFDATETWRDLASQLHRQRLAAGNDLIAELGPDLGHEVLRISRRMLGFDGRRPFLSMARRVEIAASRPR